MAATVVSTCSLNVRSLTSRLLRAIWICREFTAGPKPCNRCWVKFSANEEVVDGLKSLRGLLLLTELLLRPRLTLVPVMNPLEIPKLASCCCWVSELLPVRNALDCGVV